jgi:predicted ferric reductase
MARARERCRGGDDRVRQRTAGREGRMTLAAAGPSAAWYLTRASGAVSLLLLTAALALGVLGVRRVSSAGWPRFLVESLHRSVSLLAVAFLALHILTSVLDGYASISLSAAFIPFIGSYRPLWLGMGALAFDLLLAVAVTSLLRQRVGYRGWRAIHWLAYASWPVALLHGLGTGSDVKQSWMLLLTVACVLVVLAALLARVVAGWSADRRRRAWALGAVASFSLFLIVWLPLGPLGANWARRAGTPSRLLEHTAGTSERASR